MVGLIGRFYKLSRLHAECIGKLPHGRRPGVDVVIFKIAYSVTRKAAALFKFAHGKWIILTYLLEVG